MDKTKKIIISLGVSLLIVIILNYITIASTNSDYIELPIYKSEKLKGSIVQDKDIIKLKVKKTKENEDLLKQSQQIDMKNKVLNVDVLKGQLVTEEQFVDEDKILESNQEFQYIAIPINNTSYPTCSSLKRGDKVTIYYTAKAKDITNAIKNKKKLYANNYQEGLVTCLLFEEAEVMSVHDSTGKQVQNTVVTDILIRLKKEDVMLVANLKSQGVFDIVLN